MFVFFYLLVCFREKKSDRFNLIYPFVLDPHEPRGNFQTSDRPGPAPVAGATLLRHHGEQTEETRLRPTLLGHFRLAVCLGTPQKRREKYGKI